MKRKPAVADLLERLKGALDETERIARRAAAFEPDWTYDRETFTVTSVTYSIAARKADGTPINDVDGEHIALNDPASVLRQVAAHRKLMAWHPVETRTTGGITEYTCYCHWDPYMEVSSWHPQVLCDLTAAIAGIYELDVPECTCRDCTPKSQWAERGYA